MPPADPAEDPAAEPAADKARIALAAGPLRLELVPRIGGSIARFDRVSAGATVPLMRPAGPAATEPTDCACFPLVPFCNRIRGGSFGFLGETIRLAPTVPHDPSPVHGQGWRAPWDVVQHDEASAELRFRHDPGEWPWAYEARQTFRLDPAGLTAELTCTNLSDRPMPCGLGFHPYHPCDGATRLAAPVSGAWTVDAAVLPLAHVPAEGRYDLRDRAICGQDLDNGFDGWSGTARIDWGSGRPRLTLTSPDAGFFQVYAPAAGGLFVAEPVQHANCALNAPPEDWPDLGMAVLGPGERRRLRARWTVEPA